MKTDFIKIVFNEKPMQGHAGLAWWLVKTEKHQSSRDDSKVGESGGRYGLEFIVISLLGAVQMSRASPANRADSILSPLIGA